MALSPFHKYTRTITYDIKHKSVSKSYKRHPRCLMFGYHKKNNVKTLSNAAYPLF